eukprot:SAG31_NODE_4625_length_3087_cov_8.343039_1_plen_231_part_00
MARLAEQYIQGLGIQQGAQGDRLTDAEQYIQGLGIQQGAQGDRLTDAEQYIQGIGIQHGAQGDRLTDAEQYIQGIGIQQRQTGTAIQDLTGQTAQLQQSQQALDQDTQRRFVDFPCSDPTFSFDIAPIEQVNDEDYFPETQIEILDTSKVDYQFGEHNLPLSFLSITNRADGEEWYRRNTKVPEDMIAYLGRYHWGDLHPKYEIEKTKPKKKKKGRIFSKNHGKFKVNFD